MTNYDIPISAIDAPRKLLPYEAALVRHFVTEDTNESYGGTITGIPLMGHATPRSLDLELTQMVGQPLQSDLHVVMCSAKCAHPKPYIIKAGRVLKEITH